MKQIGFARLFICTLSCALVVTGFVPLSHGWAKTGHRISGQLAEPYLSESSRALLAELLPGESLAEAGLWADYMRSNSAPFWQQKSPPWHYVTVVKHKIKPSKKGDAITALTLFSQQVKNSKLPLQQRQLALRFIIHIVSDLHQPLHAGNGQDRGGNKIKVKFFGQKSNLHSVWDAKIIDQQKLSYTEWADSLGDKITATQAKVWCQTNPAFWTKEGNAMHKGIYPSKKNANLRWGYVYQNLPKIQWRLKQSGVRLACYLNQLSR